MKLSSQIRNSIPQVAIPARDIAESMTDVEASRDHDAVPRAAPSPHLGLPIDVDTFSRNRPSTPTRQRTS